MLLLSSMWDWEIASYLKSEGTGHNLADIDLLAKIFNLEVEVI